MQAHKSFTILLAEDDPDDRVLFQEAVAMLHVQIAIIEAETGVQTIDILQRAGRAPDIIVMDINMPLISGIDCVKIIREDARLNEIPVVIMSTTGNPATVAEAKRAGADRYAVKPASFEELGAIVRLICSTDLKASNDENFVLNSLLVSQV